MQKIVVLSGGNSPEREVSLITGKNIAHQLSENGYQVEILDPANYPTTDLLIAEIGKNNPDIIFNGLHGGDGENGKLQAIFEMNGLRFTGSGSEACMLTMNKYISKLIAADCNVSTPAHVYLHKGDKPSEDAMKALGWPVVVKPNNAGSSVGISLVESLDKLNEAIREAFNYDDNILIEQFIPGRELTVTVIADIARPVVEIKPKHGWYDYKNKYTSGNTQYIAPAELHAEEVALVQDYALRIFKRTGCRAYGRVDFRYDGDKFYFLEVNTLPGMTELSLTPMSAKADGMSFIQLLEAIMEASN